MATQGPWTILNLAKYKTLAGPIELASDAIHCVLLSSSQAISASFAGTSGNAQYSDLTGELATANGYTAGGFAVTGVSLSVTGGVVTYTFASPTLALTGALTFKYAAIIDQTTANKDIIFYVDMDTSGGSVSTASSGNLIITTPSGGIETWT